MFHERAAWRFPVDTFCVLQRALIAAETDKGAKVTKFAGIKQQ
ncbi:MAG TPA: hypothetical protein VMG39_07020 [Pseudolabrys sp.]|nr:hypothetical protein [Pseudolabrys sp.]